MNDFARFNTFLWGVPIIHPRRVMIISAVDVPLGKLPPIGDTTCKNNAHSPHLRCTINPCGPCEGCGDYEKL